MDEDCLVCKLLSAALLPVSCYCDQTGSAILTTFTRMIIALSAEFSRLQDAVMASEQQVVCK